MLVDVAAFALFGLVTGLLVGALAALQRRRVRTRTYVTALLVAGWLLVALIAIVRERALLDPEGSLPWSRLLPMVMAALGAVLLVGLLIMALSARRPGADVRARRFGRWLAPGTAVLLVVVSAVGVARDLGSRGVGPVAQPVPTPIPTAESVPAPPPGRSRAPNVLLVTVDTLRADHVGPAGYARARTPTLDRLAGEGVYFARSYTPRNGTTPAHASIFTGAYPSTTGVWTHMIDLLSPDVPTLAEVLSQRGYRTAGFFSWLALEPAYSGLQRGFQTYTDLTVNLPDYLANPTSAALAATYKRLKSTLALPEMLEQQYAFSADIEEVLDGKADVTTDAVILWLEEYASTSSSDGQPFFLWVHYWDPHYPFTPPPPFEPAPAPDCSDCPDGSVPTIRLLQAGLLQLTPRQTDRLLEYYDGEIAYMDQELGRLLATMDSMGLTDNTLIALTADHGESFGELGVWLHGGDLYIPEINVPLLMRFLGSLPSARVVNEVSSSTDIMPTILDLLGVPVPATVEGTSLVLLTRGPDVRQDRFAVSELSDRRIQSLVTPDWQLLQNNLTDETRLLRPTGMPLDQRDQADAYPEIVAELKQRLERWQESHP